MTDRDLQQTENCVLEKSNAWGKDLMHGREDFEGRSARAAHLLCWLQRSICCFVLCESSAKICFLCKEVSRSREEAAVVLVLYSLS